MTDTLRTRIAAVQREHRLVTRMIGRKAEKSCLCGWRSPEWDCTFTDHPEHVADAVIRELTIWIPPIFASAIHSWADSELAHISHHGTEGEYEMLKRLNQEAAQIANYATTHERWNGPNA